MTYMIPIIYMTRLIVEVFRQTFHCRNRVYKMGIHKTDVSGGYTVYTRQYCVIRALLEHRGEATIGS